MYRGLLSRMLVAVLLIAVIAKPCLGLLTVPVQASDISVVAADEGAVSEKRNSTCKDICLSARVEEDDAVAARPGITWTASADWAGLKALSVAPLPFLSRRTGPDLASQPTPTNVLRRLAVLSRFLL